MHHIDARLEVAVRRDVLVVGRRGDVVGERDAVVRMPEVHVDKTLICAVKRDSPLCHSHHRIVVTHVWSQDHDARVEQVRPSYVRGRREGVSDRKEFVGCPVSNHVGVDVYQLAELGLLPQVDFGESRVEVGSVHEVQVRGALITYARDGDHVVVDSLRRGLPEISIKTARIESVLVSSYL